LHVKLVLLNVPSNPLESVECTWFLSFLFSFLSFFGEIGARSAALDIDLLLTIVHCYWLRSADKTNQQALSDCLLRSVSTLRFSEELKSRTNHVKELLRAHWSALSVERSHCFKRIITLGRTIRKTIRFSTEQLFEKGTSLLRRRRFHFVHFAAIIVVQFCNLWQVA